MGQDSRKVRFGLWYDFQNPPQWRQPSDRLRVRHAAVSPLGRAFQTIAEKVAAGRYKAQASQSVPL